MIIEEKKRPILALLLDDELHACLNLQQLIKTYWKEKIEIFGIAQSTETAEAMMAQIRPDVVFIDIEMPGENAFQFLQRISPFSFEIIFVTAYDEYALRALKLNAVDYILKPISLEELDVAIKKLEEKISIKEFSKKLVVDDSYDELSNQLLQQESAKKIFLRSRGGMTVIYFADITYIEAEGSYSHFYYFEKGKKRSVVMSHPLTDYEDLLPANMFYRIHKSFLINCHQIVHISKSDFMVSMKTGAKIPLSRRRHASLLDFLKVHEINQI